jgi:hypothetical protein
MVQQDDVPKFKEPTTTQYSTRSKGGDINPIGKKVTGTRGNRTNYLPLASMHAMVCSTTQLFVCT